MTRALWLFVVFSSASAQTLQRGNGPEPDSLDPHRAQGLSAQQITRDLYEGLTREDARGAIVPGVASAWTVSPDGLLWTFTLRPEARFSDGSALLAQDFVYSLGRALSPATAAPYAGSLLLIAGAEQRLRGHIGVLGVQAVGPHSLEIRLHRPSLDLSARLSLPIAMPVKRSCVEQHGAQCTRPGKLVSNGPYQLDAWRPLAYVQLVRNPHYHQVDQVKIPAVRFHVSEDASEEARRFANGELHLTETIPPGRLTQLRARFGSALHIAPSYGTFFLGFNLTQAPFANNPKLREALTLAIDRARVVSLLTGTGEAPAFGLLPPELGGSAPPAWAALSALQRETLARAAYVQAGYSTARPLEVELRFNTSALHRRLMLGIAVMWEQVLGVRTVLRNEEWRVFVQNRRARVVTQVFRGGWNADLADPLDFLEPFAPGQPLNASGFTDQQFTAQLELARAALQPASRLQAARAAEQRLLAAHAIVPLFHYTAKHLVSAQLGGYVANPLDHHPSRFFYFRDGPTP